MPLNVGGSVVRIHYPQLGVFMDSVNNFNENMELLSVEENSTEEVPNESSSVEVSTEDILSEENNEIIYQCSYSSEDLAFIHNDLNVIHNDLQIIACLVVVLVVFKVLVLSRTLIDAIF